MYTHCSKKKEGKYLDSIIGVVLYSMETSRTIRVDTGNNIIRIAASASQEHVVVCITRSVGGRSRRDFSGGSELT